MDSGDYYLPEPYETIARIAGVSAAVEIAKIFGGEQIYFAKYETVCRPLRNAKLRSEFNGYNFKTLARRYGMTEMGVRKILTDDYIKEKQNEPLPGQVSMFDDF